MALVKFYKVTSLPGTLEPDSLYFVLNSGYTESYLTNAAGEAKAIGNSAMINALIADALSSLPSSGAPVLYAADIAARDALEPSLTQAVFVLVADASADPTVNVGAAMYAWNPSTSTWIKVAEYESMDVTVTWASIVGGPSSTPTQIDSAVSASHTHANKETLDKFGEADGLLRFNGSPIPAEWAAETVSQAEAEAGTATTRRAWTAQRVRQAIVAWWNSVSSTWGRGFVSSADAAAGRTALRLGNAATATVQTSAYDTTAGALMSVGAFGLGCDALSISLNLNNELCSSFFSVEPGTLNRPPEVNFGHAVVCANSAEAAQSVTDIVTGELWTRKLQAGVGWSNWRKHFHTGNILGTVSQSGGTPTGAIIERGSNANGEYVRFADGTQICSGRLSGGLGSATQHGSTLYYYLKPLTWPASFSDIPTLSGYGIDNMNIGTTSGYGLGLYSGQLVYITPTANVTNTDIGWTAIGRWY